MPLETVPSVEDWIRTFKPLPVGGESPDDSLLPPDNRTNMERYFPQGAYAEKLNPAYTQETAPEEATRLTGEYAAARAGALGPSMMSGGDTFTQAGLNVWGPALRPFFGDEAQRAGQELGMSSELRGQGSELSRGLRNTMSSGLQMAANTGAAVLTGGGLPAVLGLSSLQQYDQSLTEGRDAGLSEAQAQAHAVGMGILEGGIAAVFNKIPGFQTGEKVALDALKGAIARTGFQSTLKEFGKSVAKTLGVELAEEEATSFAQKTLEKLSSVDRKSWTPQEVFETARDTAIPTIMLIGGAGSVGAAGPALSRGLRTANDASDRMAQEWKSRGLRREVEEQRKAEQLQTLERQPLQDALDRNTAEAQAQQEQRTEIRQRADEWIKSSSPETIDRMADVDNPSRSAFATAAGIDRSKAPGNAALRSEIVLAAREWRNTPRALPGWEGRQAADRSMELRDVAKASDLDPHELQARVDQDLQEATTEWDMRRQVQNEVSSHYGSLSPSERKKLAEGDEDSVARLGRFDEFVTRFGPETGITPDLVKDVMANGVGPKPTIDRARIEAVARQLEPRSARKSEADDATVPDNVPQEVAPGVAFSPAAQNPQAPQPSKPNVMEGIDERTRGPDDSRPISKDVYDASSRQWDFETWARNRPKTIRKFGTDGARQLWVRFRWRSPNEAPYAPPSKPLPGWANQAAPAPVAEQPQTKSRDLPDLMRKIEPGADRGALVSFRDLRRASGLDKKAFDAHALDLARQGVLSLHATDTIEGLTQAQADEMVFAAGGNMERPAAFGNPRGTYYIGAAIRRNQSGGQVLGAKAGNPNRRPAPTGSHQHHGGVHPQPQATMLSTGVKPMRLESLWDAVHEVGQTASGKRGANRVGRTVSKRALGQYHTGTGAQTQTDWGAVTVEAHESAHRISENTTIVQNAPPIARDELQKLGVALYGQTKPAAGYKKEGFSEFMRMYLTSPTDAKSAAPEFYKHMESMLASNIQPMPDIRAKIRTTQKLADRWFRQQGAQERVQAQLVDPHSLKERLKGVVETVKNTATKRALSDIADPLSEIDRTVKELTGHDLPPSASAHKKFKAGRNTAAQVIGHMVTVETVDRSGNRTGDSLETVLAPVKGEFEKWQRFAFAKSAVEYWKNGMNPGISLADAQQVVHELDSPVFQKALDDVQSWIDRVNDYNGSYDESMAEGYRQGKLAYDLYLPHKRVGDEDSNPTSKAGGQAGAGGAKTGNISARRTGSGLPVKEVIAQLVADKAAQLKRAMQRDVSITAFKGANTKGPNGRPLAAFSHLIEEIPIPKVLDAQRSVEQLVQEIEKIGQQSDPNFKLEVDPNSTTTLDDIADQLVKFFGYADKPGTSEPIIVWRTKGPGGQVTTKWLHVKPEMQQLLDSMEPAQLTGAMRVLFGAPTALWKYGAIATSPRFGMLRNPQRDIPEMMVKVPTDMPVAERAKLIPQYFNNWARAMVGKEDAWGRQAHAMGLSGSQMLSEHNPSTARLVRKITESTGMKVFTPRSWVDGLLSGLEKFTEKVQGAESASRIVHMRAQAEALGWKPGQPLSEDDSIRLALAFKEPMGDYSAKGALMRDIDLYLPLASTPITYGRSLGQSLRKDGKWNGKAIATGIATLTIPTLALWLLNRDEEWYKNLPYYERYSRLYMPIKELNTAFLWFRNSESGMLFSALPEALIDSLYRKDPTGAVEMAKFFIESLTPQAPPLLKEAADQAANKEIDLTSPFNRGRQIVPDRGGVSKRPAVEQHVERTSETAKAIGKLTGASPMRLEHAANTLTGGLSQRTIDTAESVTGIKPASRAQQLSDLPVVGGLFPSGGLTGNRPKTVEKLYQQLDAAHERQASVEKPETPSEREARLTLESAGRALSALFKEREQAKTPDQREALMKRISSLADKALAGGTKAEFVREAVATEYRNETDPAERTKTLNNRLETLGRIKPSLGHAGVTRANVEAKRADYEADTTAARDFLKDVEADRGAAYAQYEAAVKAKAGPVAMRPSEARTWKLARVRKALGL